MTSPGPSGHRRSTRVSGHDYSTPGAYFITIVSHGRQLMFGDVVDDQVQLNALGGIVDEEWRMTGDLRADVELGVYVVMPNHVHAIVWIIEVDAEGGSVARRSSLGSMVAAFKSAVARRARREQLADQVWQRNYHDRVIRNQRELSAIQEYIIANPRNWEYDGENPGRAAMQ